MKPLDNDLGNNPIVKAIHQNKLYTEDTGRFSVTSRASNQYIMIASGLLQTEKINTELMHII